VEFLTFSAPFQAPKRNGDVDKRNLNMSLFLRGDFLLSCNCSKFSLIELCFFQHVKLISKRDMNVTKLYPHLGLTCREIELWTASYTILLPKRKQTVLGFSQTQQYMFNSHFYLDNMFWSIDLHQAIFTKLRMRFICANSIRVIWAPMKLTKCIKILKLYKTTGF